MLHCGIKTENETCLEISCFIEQQLIQNELQKAWSTKYKDMIKKAKVPLCKIPTTPIRELTLSLYKVMFQLEVIMWKIFDPKVTFQWYKSHNNDCTCTNLYNHRKLPSIIHGYTESVNSIFIKSQQTWNMTKDKNA